MQTQEWLRESGETNGYHRRSRLEQAARCLWHEGRHATGQIIPVSPPTHPIIRSTAAQLRGGCNDYNRRSVVSRISNHLFFLRVSLVQLLILLSFFLSFFFFFVQNISYQRVRDDFFFFFLNSSPLANLIFSKFSSLYRRSLESICQVLKVKYQYCCSQLVSSCLSREGNKSERIKRESFDL